MNLDIIHSLFPEGTISYLHERGFEVNGLKTGTVPQNCNILACGQEKYTQDRREFYLVEIKGYALFLRICTAHPSSEYDEFVVGHTWSLADNYNYIDEIKEKMKSLCKEI